MEGNFVERYRKKISGKQPKIKRQFIDGASKNTENDVSQCPEKHFVLRSTSQGNMFLGR